MLQSGANPTLMLAVPCDEPPRHQESHRKCIGLDLLYWICCSGDEKRAHQHAFVIKAGLVAEPLVAEFVGSSEALNTEWALRCNEHPRHWVVQKSAEKTLQRSKQEWHVEPSRHVKDVNPSALANHSLFSAKLAVQTCGRHRRTSHCRRVR